MYPNPASGLLNVDYEIPENGKNNLIKIYDVMGKLKKTIILQASSQRRLEIDCNDFANGIYSCILISDGKLLKNSKLVIVK